MARPQACLGLVLAMAACTQPRAQSPSEEQPVAQRPHAAQAIARAQTGVATPGRPRGYDQPNQYLTVTPIAPAANMEPVVPHDEQRQAAEARLQALQQKYGKRPNILIFLMDDVGWMDFGFNGGGISVGNPTPIVDRIAAEWLADARDDHDRAVSGASRHPHSADVRAAGRAAGRGHAAQADVGPGL